jgi:predicted  nucleic acid-binding Zn-ribbon protein
MSFPGKKPTDLEKLVELQAVDLELARLNTQLAAIPKNVARIDAKLATARKRVDDARAAIKASETAKRQHEQEIQALNEKILKFRGQSSSIKNNEQYKALLSEIAHAEGEIAGFEEKILDVMVNAEALQKALAEAEDALKTESVEVDIQKKEAEKAGDSDRAAAAKAQTKSKTLRSGVDESLLASYDRILKSRGYAVAEVVDHRCTACQFMLRPQVLSNVRAAQEVILCDSCGRMMYYLPEHNVKTSAVNSTGIAHQAEREWMFVPSLGTSGAFVVFINHKGNATMKAYDAMTGEAIAKRVEKNAVCQQIFAGEISEARNLFVDEANLDEKYKEQLPPEILEDLRHQLPKS